MARMTSPMTGPVAALLVACGMATLSPVALAADKIPITRLADLPTHTYALPAKPSEMVTDAAAVRALAAAIERDIRADLEKYDIQDVTAVRRMHGTLLTIAMLNGDMARARELVATVREMQEKPSAKLTSGRITEALIAASEAPDGAYDSTLSSHLESSLAALPWDVVQDDLQQTKGYLEYVSSGLVLGSLETGVDPAAAGGELSQALAENILGAAYTLQFVLPQRDRLGAAYAAVVAANAEELKPDIWAERSVSLAGSTTSSPVTLAVWDSGVDLGIDALGRQAWRNAAEVAGNGVDDDGNGLVDDINGIGYTLHGDYTSELLYPVRTLVDDPKPFQQYIKGLQDVRASVDSPEASELKRKLSSLPKADYQPFIEGLSAYANYAHGTHVAGIALDGNPGAKLLTARITFDHRIIGDRPTIAQAYRDAASVVRTVDYFVEQGVRAVNMSWGGSLAGIEEALEQHGAGGTPEERKALARRIYDIGYKALYEALRDAPDVLFVIAAGNSDNDVEFDEVWPSSFKLPNVIVAGAVDQAGDETSFTSFGNVDVYANGFEVDSFVPGGDRIKFSGTSMAAPNVTNLAGKLWAVRPELKVADVKRLIVEGADEKQAGERSIRLLNPRQSLALAAN